MNIKGGIGRALCVFLCFLLVSVCCICPIAANAVTSDIKILDYHDFGSSSTISDGRIRWVGDLPLDRTFTRLYDGSYNVLFYDYSSDITVNNTNGTFRLQTCPLGNTFKDTGYSDYLFYTGNIPSSATYSIDFFYLFYSAGITTSIAWTNTIRFTVFYYNSAGVRVGQSSQDISVSSIGMSFNAQFTVPESIDYISFEFYEMGFTLTRTGSPQRIDLARCTLTYLMTKEDYQAFIDDQIVTGGSSNVEKSEQFENEMGDITDQIESGMDIIDQVEKPNVDDIDFSTDDYIPPAEVNKFNFIFYPIIHNDYVVTLMILLCVFIYFSYMLYGKK